MTRIRPLFSICFTISASLAAALPARGQAVANVDPRALAMGGAYVAVADGWAALQWNPAGLWVSGRNEAAISYGNVPLEGAAWVDALRAARGLAADVSPGAAAATLAAAGAGLAGERAFGVHFASQRWGGGFQQVYYVDEVSRTRNGRVEIDAAALRVREFMISGSYPLAEGRFVIGATGKLVQVAGRFDSIPLEQLSASQLSAADLLGLARDATMVTDDTVFGVDVGLLMLASDKLRLGGVVKNINAPELGGGIEPIRRLPRQIRVGALLLPLPQVKLAVDLDLSNDTFVVGGRKRRELGGGAEWSADGFAVRGGVLFDLIAEDRRPLFTFGLGVMGRTIRADMAGSWAPDRDGFGWAGALAAEF